MNGWIGLGSSWYEKELSSLAERIAGDGPDRQLLETLAGELQVSSSVRFLGRKTEEELPLLYRNSRALVLPSRREGLPITLLEAGASGTICIGTQTPGIPEIIDEGVTGYLVPPESSEELANAILKTLRLSPVETANFRQAARNRIASQFSEAGMIDQYVGLYKTVLG
ncbi:MAG: glycosyltransferase family 4 protein [Candidatus Acidiferrum sp.]